MKKFVVYICLCLCICLGFGFSLSQVTISAKVDVGYIFIGDSRTVGMKDTIESKGYTCIAEIGKGLGYLKSDCFNELKDKISTKTNIKKWKIISSFGVNDLGNVSDYAEYYKNLISKLPDGNEYTLYLVPVFKVNESIAHK